MSDGENFWAALPGRLLHPTQIQILEALLWIDQPLSATDISKVFSDNPKTGLASYHLKRLTDLGILRKTGSRPRRGTVEKFYGIIELTL